MGRKRNFKPADVIAAIQGTGGIMRAIAAKLTTDWDTAKKYCHKWESTKRALAQEEQVILDMAESTLFKAIQGGDVQDAKWLLSKKARDRGYGDKIEVDGNMTYTVIPAKPPEAPDEGKNADG